MKKAFVLFLGVWSVNPIFSTSSAIPNGNNRSLGVLLDKTFNEACALALGEKGAQFTLGAGTEIKAGWRFLRNRPEERYRSIEVMGGKVLFVPHHASDELFLWVSSLNGYELGQIFVRTEEPQTFSYPLGGSERRAESIVANLDRELAQILVKHDPKKIVGLIITYTHPFSTWSKIESGRAKFSDNEIRVISEIRSKLAVRDKPFPMQFEIIFHEVSKSETLITKKMAIHFPGKLQPEQPKPPIPRNGRGHGASGILNGP